LDYSQITKHLVTAAKRPGFSIDSWSPLAELLDIKAFNRVGPFKDAMNWPDYVNFLTHWAQSSDWDCSFKRITEIGNMVFLELEERSKVGAHSSAVNSLSVYEFNGTGKIHHVDVYLQMELPSSDMLKSIESVL
jgi:hypothetical protein